VGVTVNVDNGGINHRVFHVRIARQCFEYALEDITADPIAQPLKDPIPVAELNWQVAPWTARAGDPQNSFQEHPAIASGSSRIGLLAKAKRRYLRPLGLRENQADHLHNSLFGSLNHNLTDM
jgi:hypothetical protein